ncbi:unnamed protein product [Gordionus sp. m RMFG-2023]
MLVSSKKPLKCISISEGPVKTNFSLKIPAPMPLKYQENMVTHQSDLNTIMYSFALEMETDTKTNYLIMAALDLTARNQWVQALSFIISFHRSLKRFPCNNS